MTGTQEKKANSGQNSRTINIEIPTNCFEGLFGMMTGNHDSGKAGSSCCEKAQDRCCPQTMDEDEKEQEIKIVIKRKNTTTNN